MHFNLILFLHIIINTIYINPFPCQSVKHLVNSSFNLHNLLWKVLWLPPPIQTAKDQWSIIIFNYNQLVVQWEC